MASGLFIEGQEADVIFNEVIKLVSYQKQIIIQSIFMT